MNSSGNVAAALIEFRNEMTQFGAIGAENQQDPPVRIIIVTSVKTISKSISFASGRNSGGVDLLFRLHLRIRIMNSKSKIHSLLFSSELEQLKRVNIFKMAAIVVVVVAPHL